MAERCLKMIQLTDKEPNPIQNKFRQKGEGGGGGRKVKSPEVGDALAYWFIDIRGILKARWPISIFREQAKAFYQEWLQTQDPIQDFEKLKFTNPWIFTWMRHHHVSLKLPNKRYSISSEDRKERMTEYIKNIWLVRKYFRDTFNVDIPIINGDQIPLHRNESSNQKTLTIKGADTFVKENHVLSRERITVYT